LKEMKASELYDTIEEYVDAFEKVYGNLDKKRSIEQMWLQVVEEASSVAEAVREVNYKDVVSHLANTFCWVCGLIAKCRGEPQPILHFEEDFSSIIWTKYPNKCPLCVSNPCQCLIKKREIDQRSTKEKERIYGRVRKMAQRSIEDRIRNLDRLVNMFEDIYGPNYFIMPIEEITFHFTEEVGEVAEQIREVYALGITSAGINDKKREKKRITTEFLEELADVFSWMCGILIKINYMIGNVNQILIEFKRSQDTYREIRFSEILEKYYVDKGTLVCRTCRQTPCDIKKHKTIYQISE